MIVNQGALQLPISFQEKDYEGGSADTRWLIQIDHWCGHDQRHCANLSEVQYKPNLTLQI